MFSENREFGISKHLMYSASNESIIPSILYGAFAFHDRGLTDHFYQVRISFSTCKKRRGQYNCCLNLTFTVLNIITFWPSINSNHNNLNRFFWCSSCKNLILSKVQLISKVWYFSLFLWCLLLNNYMLKVSEHLLGPFIKKI